MCQTKTTLITPTELLAPAGDLESLEAAIYFGADAVYFAHKNFGLRQGAENFDDEGLASAILLCQKHNKKAYIACNAVMDNADTLKFKNYLKLLASLKPDGIIISDPGAIALAKAIAPKIPIHLSTQANTSNIHSANFWAYAGVKRIVLSRELSLKQIAEIRAGLDKKIELEAFVHGAMCVAYSGRCLISSFVSGRSANKGACAQHCRYKYEIREKGYDENAGYLTLGEDKGESFILNSKDMNLLAHLPALAEVGIKSFKIEGRAKGAYYVATVVNAYRRAMDFFGLSGNNQRISAKKFFAPKGLVDTEGGRGGLVLSTELSNELFKASHREYFTGFYFDDAKDSQYLQASRPESLYQFVARVVGVSNGKTQIEIRNRFCKGEKLEVLSPTDNFNKVFAMPDIVDKKGSFLEVANKVKDVVTIELPFKLNIGDMLRKKM